MARVRADLLGTEVALAIMHALGICGSLFDEYVMAAEDGARHPGYRLANGSFRSVGPNAEAAALSHPERFVFLMRVDPMEPGIECWMETLSAAPGFKALRILVLTPAQGAAFADGGHDRLLAAARAHGMPVFVGCPNRMSDLANYAEHFPDVQFIIDHCGAAIDTPPGEAAIDDALALARYGNVAYKWAHAASLLSTAPYPFPDLDPKLRRAVDVFRPRARHVGQRLHRHPSAGQCWNLVHPVLSAVLATRQQVVQRHSALPSHRNLTTIIAQLMLSTWFRA